MRDERLGREDSNIAISSPPISSVHLLILLFLWQQRRTKTSKKFPFKYYSSLHFQDGYVNG
jgi:hypothetical protein